MVNYSIFDNWNDDRKTARKIPEVQWRVCDATNVFLPCWVYLIRDPTNFKDWFTHLQVSTEI